MNEARKLLLDIARCDRLVTARAGENECSEIVKCQQTDGLAGFHVPEPWNGRIQTAPILFLASNPSIGEEERFPTAVPAWSDDEVVSFFEDRFGEDDGSPIDARTFKPLASDGHTRFRAINHLQRLQAMAQDLWSAPSSPRPGLDYAVAEIVRCKSKGERGVAAAMAACSELYLRRTLDVAGARVVVVLGGPARTTVARLLGFPMPSWDEVISEGERCYLFRKHPSAWGAKKPIRESLSEAKLRELQLLVAGQIGGKGTETSA